MANYNVENFKIGACAVTYKGRMLGATGGGVQLALDMDTYDVKCDQAFNQPVKRIVTAIRLSIAVPLLEIDSGFGLLLDDSGRIGTGRIGSDLLTESGVLLLSPIDESDRVGYSFPRAIVDPHCRYRFESEKNHIIELHFTAFADNSGIVMEKISA